MNLREALKELDSVDQRLAALHYLMGCLDKTILTDNGIVGDEIKDSIASDLESMVSSAENEKNKILERKLK
jgi:hypothetical protein